MTKPSATTVKAATASATGTIFGILTTLAGIFHVGTGTGSGPVSTWAGALAVIASVAVYILHDLGVQKAQITTGDTTVAKYTSEVEAMLQQMPNMTAELAAVKAQLATQKPSPAIEEQVRAALAQLAQPPAGS